MRRVGMLSFCMMLNLVLLGTHARAGYVTEYNVDMATSDAITNVLAFDEGAGGGRITPVGNIVGPGYVTLVNPDQSADPMNDYFLLGLTDFEGTLHVVMSMTPDGFANVQGKLFFDDFDPFHESQIRQAILTATSGLPLSDPSMIGARATLDSFASTFHDELYAPTGTDALLVRFSFPVIIAVPAPSAVWGGLVLLALAGWMAYRRGFGRMAM